MKNIILYFSRDGQNYSNGKIVNLVCGNTQIAAEFIRDITGADMFQIEARDSYPADYYECTDVAKEQMNADMRPELKQWPNFNTAQYDTIYLGYPIWWGTFPMVMFTMLEHYDWAGKTIMPFCTHEGSALGHSESDIRRICRGANVMRGLAIHGADVQNSRDKIEKWIRDAGL